MKIDSIQNGIVLDHITAGNAMRLYYDLGLDKLDCTVAILKNVSSQKLGRKDIIKIDQLLELDWGELAEIYHWATVALKISSTIFLTMVSQSWFSTMSSELLES